MMFLVAALKSEAGPLIKLFNLKQERCCGSFQVFAKDDIKLIITGVGGISSAVCTTYLLTKYNAKKSDMLFNIGVAGCYCEISKQKYLYGELFIVNSLKNKSSGRSFYPDMIIETSLPEDPLISDSQLWDNSKNDFDINNFNINNRTIYDLPDKYLIDMEGAFIFEAASKFLYSQNIFILKLISDFGDTKSLSGKIIEKLVMAQSNKISELISNAASWREKLLFESELSGNEAEFIAGISDKLMLTQYQRIELEKLFRFYLIRKNNGINAIRGNKVKTSNTEMNNTKTNNDGSNDKKVDCIKQRIMDLISNTAKIREKKEGKILYEKIRKLLSEE